MMTYPSSVRSNKLFDYRIKLWQPCTVAARANVSSSDRSELLLSLRFSYIWVAAGRWMVLSVPDIILEHAFPPTGFAVACLACMLYLVAAVGWMVLSVASYHIRACFSIDGVCCGLARLHVTFGGSDGI